MLTRPTKQGAVSKSASIPAPVGGWNARDALSAMPPSDAVLLENFYPTPSDVMLRKGYSVHVGNLPDQVESLMNYSGGTTEKLFAACGTKIYDVTSSAGTTTWDSAVWGTDLWDADASAVVTSLTNARFEEINISTSGGSYLLCVNGADKLRGYDGTNWWIDGDGAHDITGVDTSTIAQINLFKNRVWLVQKNTLKAWYLPTSSIAGAAAALDFSSIASLGGYLMAMGTWTLDAGQGADDHAVFITSNGEVIVYKGTDPSDATKWALVGVWQIGAPFARRCFMKFSGDLLLLTYDGLVPLSAALQSSRLDPRVNLTDKIYYAISNATTSYGSTFGWGINYFAKANMLIINVPVSVGSQEQYVMNTISKSWCKFTGWNANCFELYADNLYYGGNTQVCKAWNTDADNDTNITANAKQAFSYFGSPGVQKMWSMARPIFLTTGAPASLVGLNVDFSDDDITNSLTYSGTASGTWDSTIWGTAKWGGYPAISKAWQSVSGIGFSAAIRMRVVTKDIETHWMSTDYVYQNGGVL